MIYAHPECAVLAGVEMEYAVPSCDAICELCLRPGVGLVLVCGVSRFGEELITLRRKVRELAENQPETKAAGLEAGVRFGKELAGCVVDCYADAAGVEWVPLSQARDAAERQARRLAEENAAFRANLEAAGCYPEPEKILHLKESRDRAIAERVRLAEEVERLKAEPAARIRRELLEAVAANRFPDVDSGEGLVTEPGDERERPFLLGERDILNALDRIVPGEG